MKKEVEESTRKAFPTDYELNLISGGEEIIYWGNDLRMKSKMKGTSQYSKLLNLHNGRMVAAKDNGEIDIINLYNREIEFTLKGHTELIVTICAVDTENLGEHIIATGAYDHTLRIWNIINKECICVVKAVGYIYSIIYDQRRGYLINSSDGIVTIRNYKTLETLRKIDHGKVRIIQLLQINEEQIASVCNLSKLSLRIWNIESGETIQDIYIPDTKGFVCGAILNKSTLLLGEANNTWGDDNTGKVHTFDLSTYTVTNTYHIHQAGFDINQICPLSPAEAVSCSKDQTIKLFNIQTGEVKLTLSHHRNEVNSILPVLLPLNAQFENISDISKEYIIQIGGDSFAIKSHLLHRIAPKFRFNIHQRAENIIQIEFMDADISFNQLFMPFIHNKLIINEDNLAEAIILGEYFPMIKIQYERFIKENSASLNELFDINKANYQLWNNIFPDQAQDESNYDIYYELYIYIYIILIIYLIHRYFGEVSEWKLIYDI